MNSFTASYAALLTAKGVCMDECQMPNKVLFWAISSADFVVAPLAILLGNIILYQLGIIDVLHWVSKQIVPVYDSTSLLQLAVTPQQHVLRRLV